jgi:hypothetical protein
MFFQNIFPFELLRNSALVVTAQLSDMTNLGGDGFDIILFHKIIEHPCQLFKQLWVEALESFKVGGKRKRETDYEPICNKKKPEGCQGKPGKSSFLQQSQSLPETDHRKKR